MDYLLLALGGAIGSLCRFFISEFVYDYTGREFPYGILTVNVVGSFLMGVLATLIVNRFELGPAWRMGILVGFLGGFTTFSSFSLDTVQLLQGGHAVKAISYVLLSVILGVIATFLGILIVGE